MRQAFKNMIASGLVLACILAFQNCSKVAFSEDESASLAIKNGITGDSTDASSTTNSGDDPSCRVDITNSTKNVKVLFLIDTSGSNATGNNNGAGTDEGKVWRLNTINSFINTYGSKSNFSFAFATFQNTSAAALIASNGHGVFSNNMSDINSAMDKFKNTPDTGGTPYAAALSIVGDIIKYDQQITLDKAAGYIVVMISDGSPSDSSYKDSKNGINNLTTDVKAVLAAAPGQISFNTVFLYNQSAPAASEKVYLQKISSLGSGSFIEASSNQTLQISDTVQVPKTVCH